MSKALRIEPDIGLREILEISAGSDFDVVYNPLLKGPGGQMGGTFLKPAPTHEGMTKGENESMNEYLDRLGQVSDVDNSVRAVQDFLDNAQSAIDDRRGLALFRTDAGELQPMPRYSAELSQYAGNGSIEETYPAGATRQLMNDFVSMTGDRAALPAVY